MNAVIVLSGATIIFTDDNGNVLDRYAVESIAFANRRKETRKEVDAVCAEPETVTIS